MAFAVMAYIAMAYIVMALYSYGLYSYGLYRPWRTLFELSNQASSPAHDIVMARTVMAFTVMAYRSSVGFKSFFVFVKVLNQFLRLWFNSR